MQFEIQSDLSLVCREMEKRKVQINHVLDPLLSRLVKSYVDDEDMRRRIHELFYFLNDGNDGTP